eukprot:7668680-Alexandrium_andersonii.AAC.1
MAVGLTPPSVGEAAEPVPAAAAASGVSASRARGSAQLEERRTAGFTRGRCALRTALVTSTTVSTPSA